MKSKEEIEKLALEIFPRNHKIGSIKDDIATSCRNIWASGYKAAMEEYAQQFTLPSSPKISGEEGQLPAQAQEVLVCLNKSHYNLFVGFMGGVRQNDLSAKENADRIFEYILQVNPNDLRENEN